MSTRAEDKAEALEALSRGLATVDADRQILDSREFRIMATARERGLTLREIAKVKGCSAAAVHRWLGRRDADGQMIRVADAV